MKLLIEVHNKEHLPLASSDGIILPLMDYAVESTTYFSLEEIKDIRNKYFGEIFIKINKNLLNDDINMIIPILKELDTMDIKGIFFYDLAILQLKKELGLSVDLVWNQTHMVNNYKTCDYYYSKGVKYALLGKELTLEENIEIINKSKITSMVEVVSRPSIAFSKRKLLTNYAIDSNEKRNNHMKVFEKVSKESLDIIEDSNGTNFFLDTITNGTGVIKKLYENHCSYIIMREYGLEDIFLELVSDTMEYIKGNCIDFSYVEKYKKLGDNTNFFYKKTIYKVK